MVEIPLSKREPLYTKTFDLEENEYSLLVHWNPRSDSWHISMYSVEGFTVFSDLVVSTGMDLLRKNTSEYRPAGSLLAIDTTDSGQQPTFDSFGDTVKLFYMTLADAA